MEAILVRYGFNEVRPFLLTLHFCTLNVQECMISTATLHRYGLRLYEDQLVAPLYDADRSLVRIIRLDPNTQTPL